MHGRPSQKPKNAHLNPVAGHDGRACSAMLSSSSVGMTSTCHRPYKEMSGLALAWRGLHCQAGLSDELDNIRTIWLHVTSLTRQSNLTAAAYAASLTVRPARGKGQRK